MHAHAFAVNLNECRHSNSARWTILAAQPETEIYMNAPLYPNYLWRTQWRKTAILEHNIKLETIFFHTTCALLFIIYYGSSYIKFGGTAWNKEFLSNNVVFQVRIANTCCESDPKFAWNSVYKSSNPLQFWLVRWKCIMLWDQRDL